MIAVTRPNGLREVQCEATHCLTSWFSTNKDFGLDFFRQPSSTFFAGHGKKLQDLAHQSRFCWEGTMCLGNQAPCHWLYKILRHPRGCINYHIVSIITVNGMLFFLTNMKFCFCHATLELGFCVQKIGPCPHTTSYFKLSLSLFWLLVVVYAHCFFHIQILGRFFVWKGSFLCASCTWFTKKLLSANSHGLGISGVLVVPIDIESQQGATLLWWLCGGRAQCWWCARAFG